MAPLIWAGLRVSKLRFRDQSGMELSPEDLPEFVIESLTAAVQPLLEVGFQVETLRKNRRGLAESWQAVLSSAEGMVWCVVESPEDAAGPAAERAVTLYSVSEDSNFIETRDGGSRLPLPELGSQARSKGFSSALAQSEAHAAVVLESEVALKSLTKGEFLTQLEDLDSRRMDSLFERGWFKEDLAGEELRVARRKLLPAGLLELRNQVATRKEAHAGGVSWWPASIQEAAVAVQEVALDSLPESGIDFVEEGVVSTAEGTIGSSQTMAGLPEFPENLAVADSPTMEEAATLPELATESEEEAVVDSWERDLALYREGSAKKSWTYWLRAQGKELLLVLGLVGLVAWSVASGSVSQGFALSLLFVFLLHELGHVVVMLIRRKWDWSLLLIPIPRPMAAKKWPIEGGVGEVVSLLAGPIPGLTFGWALMGYAFLGGVVSEGLLDFALAALVVNSFSLLPFRPLDGGRLWDILLFRNLPMLRVLALALGGFVLLVTFWLGVGPLAIVGALLLWTAIPGALQRIKMLPWMRANLAGKTEWSPELALAVVHKRGTRRFLKGPGAFAKIDELVGLAMAKSVGRAAVILGVLAILAAVVLPIVLPGVALGRRSFAWLQAKQEAQVLVQEYLGARSDATKGENVDYDLQLLQKGFAAFPNHPEKVLADPYILTAMQETKWRGVGAWIDESPNSRQMVVATCVEALSRDAARAADSGLPDRAFTNLSLAIRILVECEPRHSLDSWLAWSELERDVLKELEDVSSRYPLQDKFSQWYESALAKTPRQTSRKLAGLMLQEEANATLTLRGSAAQLLQPAEAASNSSPGVRFLALFQRVGNLVPVESIREQIELATAVSKAHSPFSAPDVLERKGADSAELRTALARIGINRSYREIAIAALQIKRLGTDQAEERVANLQEQSGFKASIQNDGERESLMLSRLNENGDEVQMEWLLRR